MDQIILNHIKDSRLESLFTKDLVQLKEVNYDGYLANLNNWKLVIEQLFKQGVFQPDSTCMNTALFNDLQITNSLGRHFTLGKNILSVVINSMVNESEQLIPLTRFESSTSGLAKSTMTRLMHSIISSTIYNLDYNVLAKDGSLKPDLLVSLQEVRKLSLAIYEWYKYEYLSLEEFSDYVVAKDHLYSLVEALNAKGTLPHVSPLDFKLAVIYLERELKKIRVTNDVIRFQGALNDKEQVGIQETDQNIALLKYTIYKINKVITLLTKRQEEIKSEVLCRLKSNNKSYARHLVANLKKIEATLQKQSVQLTNLTTLLDQINLQSFNSILIETITLNSQLLLKLNQNNDLEQLEQVIDTMSDNIEESKKIDALMSSNVGVDEQEVELELDELNSQVKREAEAEKEAKAETEKESKLQDKLQDAQLESRLNKLKGSLTKTEFGVDDGSVKVGRMGKTEGKTEVGKTEAGKTEVGKTEVGKTEAGKTEVGKTEAGKTEVGKTEAGKTEAGKTEVGKTEAGKTEVGKTEAGKTEAGKTEAGTTEDKKPLPA